MNKKVYQQDIADSLGISKNAVSRALRGCSDISQATIEKVITVYGKEIKESK